MLLAAAFPFPLFFAPHTFSSHPYFAACEVHACAARQYIVSLSPIGARCKANPSFSANASSLDLKRSKKGACASMLLFLCLALRLALRSAANFGHRNRDARAIRFCIFSPRFSLAIPSLSPFSPFKSLSSPKRVAFEPAALLFLHLNLGCLILKTPPYNGKWQSLNNRALILPARANLA